MCKSICIISIALYANVQHTHGIEPQQQQQQKLAYFFVSCSLYSYMCVLVIYAPAQVRIMNHGKWNMICYC